MITDKVVAMLVSSDKEMQELGKVLLLEEVKADFVEFNINEFYYKMTLPNYLPPGIRMQMVMDQMFMQYM